MNIKTRRYCAIFITCAATLALYGTAARLKCRGACLLQGFTLINKVKGADNSRCALDSMGQVIKGFQTFSEWQFQERFKVIPVAAQQLLQQARAYKACRPNQCHFHRQAPLLAAHPTRGYLFLDQCIPLYACSVRAGNKKACICGAQAGLETRAFTRVALN